MTAKHRHAKCTTIAAWSNLHLALVSCSLQDAALLIAEACYFGDAGLPSNATILKWQQ